MRKSLIVSGILGSFLMSGNVSAQEAGEFTVGQNELNLTAVEAVKAGEHAKAELIFSAMLNIAEYDLLWMNLGRTYAAQDKCLEAKDAFSHVMKARQLAGYHEIVAERLPSYMEELDSQCNAPVVVKCDPVDMTISIDGGKEATCSNAVYNLVPGQHVIVGKAMFEGSTSVSMNSVLVDAKAGELTSGELTIVDMRKVLEEAGVSLEDYQQKSKLFKILGYSMLGVGTALAAGGGALTLVKYIEYNDEYERSKVEDVPNLNTLKKQNQKYMNGGYAMLAVGGGMLAAGITLVVIDAKKFQPQIEKLQAAQAENQVSFEIAPMIDYNFAGLGFSGTF